MRRRIHRVALAITAVAVVLIAAAIAVAFLDHSAMGLQVSGPAGADSTAGRRWLVACWP